VVIYTTESCPYCRQAERFLTQHEVPFTAIDVTGAIVPIDASDAGPIDDPGRFRVTQLFAATYGATRDEVEQQLGRVRFFGWRYPVHRRAVDAFTRVAARLEPFVEAHPEFRVLVKPIGGTWSWRTISRSKNLSAHAWGIAIDLNPEWGHYWRWTRRGEPLVWRNRIPQEVVDAFEAEGFIWGGRWVHFDTMHFEYRPELLSPQCK
ncbi:MAG: M15 family metallopeptidase, partial [Archangium sp.]|nr:M15 family metallopeptidase [Archangium sp.]